MTDHPDVYADGLTITSSPLGVTLSFTRSEPETPGVTDTAHVVIACRVRLPRPIAEGLRDMLAQALDARQPGSQTVSH